MALDFALLTADQIWGDKNGNGQLDVMKKYGTKVSATDLAVLLGANMSNCGTRDAEGELTCLGWSASLKRNNVRCFDCAGEDWYADPYERYLGIRPVIPADEAERLISYGRKLSAAGVESVQYGEYPQTVVDAQTRQKLEQLDKNNALKETGKKYTFDAMALDQMNVDFMPIIYSEYEMEGTKFIRLGGGKPADEGSRLSNGEQISPWIAYWVQVEPVEWLKDPSGIWVSKKCLLAGIQFDKRKKEYDGDFSKTFMKHYLDTYFAKQIEPTEWILDRETIKDLNEKLAEVSDLEKVKSTVQAARTPERTEETARIMRVRKAKAILSAAAKRAQKEGNLKMLQEIMKLAKPYAVRDAVIRRKFHLKRAERHAKGNRE